jgi:hypothetical protein
VDWNWHARTNKHAYTQEFILHTDFTFCTRNPKIGDVPLKCNFLLLWYWRFSEILLHTRTTWDRKINLINIKGGQFFLSGNWQRPVWNSTARINGLLLSFVRADLKWKLALMYTYECMYVCNIYVYIYVRTTYVYMYTHTHTHGRIERHKQKGEYRFRSSQLPSHVLHQKFFTVFGITPHTFLLWS